MATFRDKTGFRVSLKVQKQVKNSYNILEEKGISYLSIDEQILIGLRSGFHTTTYTTMKDDAFKPVNGSMINKASFKIACISFVNDIFLSDFRQEVRLYKDNILVLSFKPKTFKESLSSFNDPNEIIISNILQKTQSYFFDKNNKDSINCLKIIKYYLYLIFNNQEK